MLSIGKKRLQPHRSPKIYLSVSSEGYGHSSRALAIAQSFPRHEILVGTYGYALPRFHQAGWDTVNIPQEYKLMGSSGQFDVHQTIFSNHSSLFNLSQVIQHEKDVIEQNDVTLVVVDGRVAPVIAASRLGVPCLVVTNQSDFYPFFDQHDSHFVKLFGKSFEWWLQNWLLQADEILIPDFYPPDTICLYNLSPSFHIKKRTRFTGPLVSWSAKDILPIHRPLQPNGSEYEQYVVVSLGGHAYRRPLLDAVLSIASQFPHTAFDLLTSLPVFQLPENVRRLGHVDNAPSYFKAADAVITQAGHSTAMELLTLGVPSVVVPDLNQTEQENNAQRLASVGVSQQVTYTDLNTSSDTLAKALHTVLTQSRYQRHALQFNQKCQRLNGCHNSAEILSEYAHRLVTY